MPPHSRRFLRGTAWGTALHATWRWAGGGVGTKCELCKSPTRSMAPKQSIVRARWTKTLSCVSQAYRARIRYHSRLSKLTEREFRAIPRYEALHNASSVPSPLPAHRQTNVKKPARGTLPRRPAQPSQSSFTQQVAARNPTPRDPLHIGAPYAFAMASSTAAKNPLLVIVAPVTASTWVDPASTTAAGSTLSASPPSEGVSLFSSTSTFWMAPSA